MTSNERSVSRRVQEARSSNLLETKIPVPPENRPRVEPGDLLAGMMYELCDEVRGTWDWCVN